MATRIVFPARCNALGVAAQLSSAREDLDIPKRQGGPASPCYGAMSSRCMLKPIGKETFPTRTISTRKHEGICTMSDNWLPSLKTDTPQAGFELAVKLSRMGVKVTQPSDQVRSHLRAAYEQDSAQLIASSHVIAVHFQTVAAANNWWR